MSPTDKQAPDKGVQSPPTTSPPLDLMTKMLNDWFTDATGTGYSIGRALAVWLFLPASMAPLGMGIYMAYTGKVAMNDWVALLGGCVAYYPSLAAAATALILGTAPTDPGGRWWDKKNAPAPVVTPPSE